MRLLVGGGGGGGAQPCLVHFEQIKHCIINWHLLTMYSFLINLKFFNTAIETKQN